MTDVLHDRALVILRSRLVGRRHSAAKGWARAGDPVVEAGQDGWLLALERVGAIDAGEAAAWRERFRDAVERPEPADEPVTADAREQARAHLEGLLERAVPSDGQAGFSAIVAYAKTGVFDAEEALAWRERFRARLGLDPERPPRCSRRELVRVVAGPAARVSGLRVTTVELYRDGVVVLWHHTARWDDGPETPRIWSWDDMNSTGVFDADVYELADDLGTRYVGGDDADFGINGGGRVTHFGTSAFTPAVPAAARKLVVPRGNDAIEIDLAP